MAAQQIELKRLERAGLDPDIGERSEAGIDAIGRLLASRARVDDGAGGAHPPASGVGRARGLAAVRDREQLLERERGTVKKIMCDVGAELALPPLASGGVRIDSKVES